MFQCYFIKQVTKKEADISEKTKRVMNETFGTEIGGLYNMTGVDKKLSFRETKFYDLLQCKSFIISFFYVFKC